MEIRVDGNQVRKLREAKLWTQEELAERCRVHARTVQRVETLGTGSGHTIRALADALGVSPHVLEATPTESMPADPAPVASAPAPAPATLGPDVLAFPWLGVAAAFLWVALACLVYVPTAAPGKLASSVAALGFACFVLGLWCFDRRRRVT